MRVGDVVDEGTIPFAAEAIDNVAFANALFAEEYGRELILSTGMKDARDSGGQPIQGDFACIRRVVGSEEFNE